FTPKRHEHVPESRGPSAPARPSMDGGIPMKIKITAECSSAPPAGFSFIARLCGSEIGNACGRGRLNVENLAVLPSSLHRVRGGCSFRPESPSGRVRPCDGRDAKGDST